MPGSAVEQSIVGRLLGLYKEAEQDLTRLVNNRLEQGITQTGWTERKLLETRALQTELRSRMDELVNATSEEAHLAIRQSYAAAAAQVDAQLGTWGVAPRTNVRSLMALEHSLTTGLSGTHFAILRQHEDLYRRIVAEASAASAAGLASRDQVRRNMMARFQREGIHGFTDRAGRHWTLDNYTEMASRTATAQANLQGTADRLDRAGIRYGKVSNSPEECELCRPWEGRILQVSGPREGYYSTLDDAKSAGLFHPRCTHGIGAYIKGLTKAWELAGEGVTDPEEAERLRQEARASADARARWGASSSESMFKLENGQWTAERTKLHEDILNQLLAGKTPVRNPVARMMGGGPASGKSVTLDSGVVKLPKNSVHIDPDAIKSMLPEYRASVEGGKKWAASFAHEESSYLSKQLAARASQRRMNLVLDGTGDSGIESLTRKVQSLRAGGQRVVAEYVTVDTEVAVARAAARAARTGRVVPDSYIRGVHADVSKTFPQAVERKLFDEARLWDTDVPRGMKPRLIAHYKDGKLTIHDEQAWLKFRSKDPDFTPPYRPAKDELRERIGTSQYVDEDSLLAPALGAPERAIWEQQAAIHNALLDNGFPSGWSGIIQTNTELRVFTTAHGAHINIDLRLPSQYPDSYRWNLVHEAMHTASSAAGYRRLYAGGWEEGLADKLTELYARDILARAGFTPAQIARSYQLHAGPAALTTYRTYQIGYEKLYLIAKRRYPTLTEEEFLLDMLRTPAVRRAGRMHDHYGGTAAEIQKINDVHFQ